MHPDKYKPDKTLSKREQKEAHKRVGERFARLSTVKEILRGPGRERYDHFLNNGFPKWRGTGYYYARFRPGLGTVLVGLYLAAGAAHYGILYLNGRQQRGFMESYIREARTAAWGSAGVPGLDAALGEKTPSRSATPVAAGTEEENGAPIPRNRKERRAKPSKKDLKERKNLGVNSGANSGTATPEPGNDRKRVTARTGKVFLVGPNGDVFLVHDTEDGVEEYMLDINEIEGPKWRNTILATVPMWFWRMTVGRVLPSGKSKNIEESSESEDDAEGGEAEDANGEAVVKKKGTAKKLERTDGAPRRRVKGRGKK